MVIFADRVNKVSSRASSSGYNWDKDNMADGSYYDDGCCMDWYNNRVCYH